VKGASDDNEAINLGTVPGAGGIYAGSRCLGLPADADGNPDGDGYGAAYGYTNAYGDGDASAY